MKLAAEHTRIVLVTWTTSTVEHVNTFIPLNGHSFLHFSPDLRALGQTTKLERSTLAQVQARIAYLREKTKEASNAKAFDFDQRLAEVKAKEVALRQQKKAEKKEEKEKARLAMIQDVSTQDVEMTELMGFGGFGSSKK